MPKASKTVTLVSGAERRDILSGANQKIDKKETKDFMGAGTVYPPIEGNLSPKEWRRIVEDLWCQDEPVVIHTMIIPDGRDPRQLSMEICHVKEERRSRLPVGVFPEQAMRPAHLFDAYIEQQVIPKRKVIPNHFIVATKYARTSGLKY